MTPLTENKYTITDSSNFAEEMCKQHPDLCMAHLDVDFLFTNIPLEKNSDTSIDCLHNDNENTPEIPMDISQNLLNVVTKEWFLIFNNKFFTQVDGVAMESPLALANTLMPIFENKWLKEYLLSK